MTYLRQGRSARHLEEEEGEERGLWDKRGWGWGARSADEPIVAALLEMFTRLRFSSVTTTINSILISSFSAPPALSFSLPFPCLLSFLLICLLPPHPNMHSFSSSFSSSLSYTILVYPLFPNLLGLLLAVLSSFEMAALLTAIKTACSLF